MISFLRGRLASVRGDVVVIDMGAVGVQAHVTASVLAAFTVGSIVDLPATLVVREESLTLYGFASEDEREVFELLQTVSGVGPKVALAIISTLGTDALRVAIAREDLAALTKVSGVGKKGAERLIIELRDKIGIVATTSAPAQVSEGWQGQVRSALLGLGWAPRDADTAISHVEVDSAHSAAVAAGDVAALLRAALRGLDRA